MKKAMRFRITAVLAAAMTAACTAAMPSAASYNTATVTQLETFTGPYQTYWKWCEQEKFPAGKYWNGGDPEVWTDTPCASHSSWDNCTYVPFRYVYNAGYTTLPSSETYGSLCQCYGFARKLAQDFYGGCKVWLRHRYSTDFQFRAGDQVRINYDAHSVFITEVNGDKITFADCNWDNHCGIRWDVSATIANGKFTFGGRSFEITYIDRAAMAGDIDGDSQVTEEDIEYIRQIAEGTYSFTGKQLRAIKEAADLNNDGVVDMDDYDIALDDFTNRTYIPGTLGFQHYLTDLGSWS